MASPTVRYNGHVTTPPSPTDTSDRSPSPAATAIADTVGVLAFVALYAFSWALVSAALALCGLDLVTALTGAATALGNVGPGLGDVIGPAGNFAPLPDSAKWILSLAMLLGRLELIAVLVLLSRALWRA